MREALERWIDRLLAASPLQAIFERRARHRLTVLAYHGVDDPGQFESQLLYLTRRYRPISLEDLERILEGTPCPPGAVLVTFDDGEPSLLTAGLPVLTRYETPAVTFVVAGLLDRSEPLWWREAAQRALEGGRVEGVSFSSPEELVRQLKRMGDEDRLAALEDLRRTAPRVVTEPYLRSADLRTLVEGGVAVGNHTLTHPSLPRCDERKVRAEIRDAHGRLMDALGRPPRSFAYPYGDFDQRAEPTLEDLGYRATFLFDHRSNQPEAIRGHRISRIRVNSHSTMNRFRILTSGLHSAIHHRLGRD